MKKNYRPVMYHNWRHAFNVAQTMFTILKVMIIMIMIMIMHLYSAFSLKGSNALYNESQGVRPDISL